MRSLHSQFEEFSTLLKNAKTKKDTDALKRRKKELAAAARNVVEQLIGPVQDIESDDGSFVVKDKTSHLAFYSAFGRRLFGHTYEQTNGFHEGLAAIYDLFPDLSTADDSGVASEAYGWKYVDTRGVRYPPSLFPYEQAEPFTQGAAFVQTFVAGRHSRFLWHIIDKRGKTISSEDYEEAVFMRKQNRALVRIDVKPVIILRQGKRSVETIGNWKLIDLQGHTIKDALTIDSPHVEGDFFVCSNGITLDKNGESVNRSLFAINSNPPPFVSSSVHPLRSISSRSSSDRFHSLFCRAI